GKLVLVTAINPTPSGEGKSTVSIGLADALNRLGKKTILALREPSMGPVMGMKGGATGGGFSQVLPMEDINLHFTGDMHAITACNNALSAFIDNHIHQGNELNIDPRRILWKRVVDINDRALRQIVVGLGGPLKGVPREDGFDITVASEIMAVLCLATDLEDLKNRVKEIVIGYTYEKAPIRVQDLGVQGALTVLLKDAIKPNLVQTIEGTPTLIHGGPFANIAHGCNSVIATKTALKLGDYCVTEAGFGADLGAEKFLDIKVPILKKAPDVIVIVATIRAIKMNGGVNKKDLKQENKKAVQNGFVNLKRHIKNMKSYGVPVVVSINQFETDTRQEIEVVEALCQKEGVTACPTTVWENGGQGGIALAQAVEKACSESNGPSYQRLYQNETSIEEKIRTIATNLYGAKDVSFSNKARKQLVELKKNGWQELPICMAKTQYSF